MKQFCETYSNADEIISTLLREISNSDTIALHLIEKVSELIEKMSKLDVKKCPSSAKKCPSYDKF